MKSLGFRKTAMLIMSVTIILLACEKDEVARNQQTPQITYSVHGLYEGTYTVNGMSQPPLAYYITVYPDGSVLTKGKLGTGDWAYSTGSWTLTDSIFVANISTLTTSPTIQQRINAIYSDSGYLHHATWNDVVNPFTLNSGEFQNMNRVN